MVGLPDGLGATNGPRGRDFTLFMNHEVPLNAPGPGVARRHGVSGAFVSEWKIDSHSLEVEEGQDLIDPGVRYWNYAARQYSTDAASAGQVAQFARFCSGFLSEPGQLYNEQSDRGYNGQIYFGNEENGDVGRVFGVTTDGQAQQLPRLGLFSWENTIVGMNKGDVTFTQGQEDTATGQLWVYIGRKLRNGNAFDRAGLTGGQDFVVDLQDEAVSTDAGFRTTYGKNNPAPIRSRPRRGGRLEPVGERPEHPGDGEGAHAQPHRGRGLRPPQSGGLLLRDDRGRQGCHLRA